MSLNTTPSGERTHIGIFGKRNAGKSSLLNAITGQSMAIVSDTPGTTTDPVNKAMEILPLGPVMFTDTPGFDDEGSLGKMRVDKSYDALRKTDIVLLTLNADEAISAKEKEFIKNVSERNLPYIICVNKCDLNDADDVVNELLKEKLADKNSIVTLSAKTLEGINELKEKIAKLNKKQENHVIADLLEKGDTVVLVVPIDESAPKGRLILPQQQVIRDILEAGCIAVVTKETELKETLLKLSCKPKAVITDSQAFGIVSKIVPDDIYLSSFSILMARYKGDLDWQVEGAKAIDDLKDGAKILISEGCTHHRQCADIGTVKIPNWLSEYTDKKFELNFTSGGEFPNDLSEYDLIIHCGGCTLNEQEMKYRIAKAKEANVPITNYGVLISYMNGILERSLRLLTLAVK